MCNLLTLLTSEGNEALSPFQAWHLSSGFVVKLFSKHWEWNLTLKVHCKEILKPSIKNKLEVMCYLFSWTSVCTTQTIVDEELRHCHSQGKASGLGACHLSSMTMKQRLDNLVTSVTSQTQGKTDAKLSIWTTRNWKKHDMYTKFQASTHSCTPLEMICTRMWEMYVPDFHDWFTIQGGWGKHVVLQKLPSSQHIFFNSWIVTFFYWCPISKLQKMDVNVTPYMDFHPTMVFQHLFSDKTPKFGRVHCYLPAAMNGC